MKLQMKIHHPSVNPDARNFFLRCWPPQDDFPIIVDAEDNVVSRYGDSYWDFTVYSRRSERVTFEGGRRNTRRIDQPNAQVFRQVVAWWMYGPRPMQRAGTVVSFGSLVRGVFAKCTEMGVVASRLWRHPKVISSLAQSFAPANAENLLLALHELYEWRDDLGFMILDKPGLRQFAAECKKRSRKQTPYVPPRIWSYQASRLREFLLDFEAHRQGIEDCFRYCVEAYRDNFGSIAKARDRSRSVGRAPFRRTADGYDDTRYHGTFWETASHFGIGELLRRWNGPAGLRPAASITINSLSNYLTLAGHVGTAYLINFSGMRIEEALRLRASCLRIERDPQLGAIHLLRGPTKKTIDDDGALWVTSPSSELAVRVLRCVAELRLGVGKDDPSSGVRAEDILDPPLRVRTYEPWATSAHEKRALDIRLAVPSYFQLIDSFPLLFDVEQIRITKQDLDLARLVTPSLDSTVFYEGAAWHFTWHQLRRCAAVNMTGSGLVSDSSLQYQLKHLTRAMSLYYARGFSHLSLNKDFKAEYIRTIYEMLNLQFSALWSSRYVSPYGDAHKEAKLRLLSQGDSKALLARAKKGLVPYRETVLGGCLKSGPCSYGGIDNLVECGGGRTGQACHEAMFDKTKRLRMLTLKREIQVRLSRVESDAPEHESLAAQLRSVELALTLVSSHD